jgi:drug/metabolite transporter (DMT)-like permease
MHDTSLILGLALALGASLCWGAANVAIQRAGRAIGPVRALVWAQVAGGVGAAAVAPWLDHRTPLPTASLVGWAALAGVSALVAYASMFFAFARAPLSLAVPIMSSWSLVAAAVSVALLDERLGSSQLAGAALVVAGVVLVSLRTSTSPPADAAPKAALTPAALAASFGAALGFGLLVPAIHHLAPAVGRIGAIPVVYALDLALGVPIALALRLALGPPRGRAWTAVLAAGLFETLGFACLSFATLHAPVAIVSPVASLSAALTALGAWVFLGERPGVLATVGALLAGGGVVLLAA